MSPRVRVYLGPSLSACEGRAVLPEADFQPPITYPDLPLAVVEGVDIVVIIDAAFVQTLSATPTQILHCLRHGMVVFGASSAGALRAVECAPYGMRGVGRIYELFANGFEAEDELALGFDPATGRAVSEALLNVRFAVAAAQARGLVGEPTAAALVAAAEGLFFAERTWRAIVETVRGDAGAVPGELVALRDWLDGNPAEANQKGIDALACLAEVKAYVDAAAALDGVAEAEGAPCADRFGSLGGADTAAEEVAAATLAAALTGDLPGAREVARSADAANGRRHSANDQLALRIAEAAGHDDWALVLGVAVSQAQHGHVAPVTITALRGGLLRATEVDHRAERVIDACRHLVLSRAAHRRGLFDAVVRLWADAERCVGRPETAARLDRAAGPPRLSDRQPYQTA